MPVSAPDPELDRIRQLASALNEALIRYKAEPKPYSDAGDPFAFITADAERESLRVTAEHPDWTAAEVAAEVRRRLPGYDTQDKSIRFYWKIARRDARKRALLPPQRLT